LIDALGFDFDEMIAGFWPGPGLMGKLRKCHELRDRVAACVAPIKYSEVMALVARSIPKLPKTAKVLWRTKLLSKFASLWAIRKRLSRHMKLVSSDTRFVANPAPKNRKGAS